MGTLTGGDPVLDSYCRHKLPSSCRLSSIGECCACYDERGHSASYSTYIDGVGFVLRGTRWQRYCWFCKEFWQNRVEASGLRTAQTRIPEVPDCTDFLNRWYEFHQGHRIVKRDDGSEERVAVLGEDFKDVPPGCLPRTLEELRAGRERSEMEEREREQAREQQTDEQPIESGPTLDQTLDQLFEAAAAEERPARRSGASPTEQQDSAAHMQPQNNNVHAQSMVAAGSRNREYQARRVAALRRELHRMRSGIERVVSGLRDLGEGVPDHTEASHQLSDLGRTLDSIAGVPSHEEAQRAIDSVNTLASNIPMTQNDRTLTSIQSRVDEARQHVEEARRSRDQAAGELDLAEQELRHSQSRLRQVQNEQRTTENYMRTFGTREEVVAQGENYESPIGGMFDRAIERFRAAEEVRREERTLRQVLTDEARSGGETAVARLMELEQQERDVWGVPRPLGADGRSAARSRQEATGNMIGIYPRSGLSSREEGHELEEYYSLLLQRQERVSAPEEETSADVANGLAASDSPMTPRGNGRHQRDSSLAINGAPETEPGPADEPLARNSRDILADTAVVAGPPGQQLDDDPTNNNDRGLDAVFVLSALSYPDGLRSVVLELPAVQELDSITVAYLLIQLETNSLDTSSRESIENIMSNTSLIWGVGLPAERNRRRRERGEQITFTSDAFDLISSGLIIVHDVEVMAEAFQMSAQLRRMSGLSAPEQLAMLYRLQRGDRSEPDRRILLSMLGHEPTFEFARHIHEQDPNDLTIDESSRRATLDDERREAARQGDNSRSELDTQRRATMNVAVAAGRMAMNAGPTALLEQMASRDAETRAAYERLQQNGFVPAETMSSRRFRDSLRDVSRPMTNDGRPAVTLSESDVESDGESRGLDAKDSGRPEQPMTDEQMTLKLECQVCYSQLATIAMLPCGHLTMCQWCSDQHSPTMAHDRTRPRTHAACPVCRKSIRQKVKVFRS
ncbi:unnamed protein product [Zymoseptoria tritici ST99CH_1A5]|uniref:RING-type domain-containing protein n=2 Tax=Zymoseptoria tritici TaxID=1047171 RepID=A0A2H1G658_ZYMTR|nr:unnamed protein product [Zymoseptoria tritici ST99CH_1E4]SMY22906.1 unnamed protein product [Zymoseptoria tritici ST99CH_1A5]